MITAAERIREKAKRAREEEDQRRAKQDEERRQRLNRQISDGIATASDTVDWIIHKCDEAAGLGASKYEWQWDTLYGIPGKTYYDNATVAKAVETEIARLLTQEGFNVEQGYSGSRHGSINSEGYGGGYQSSYGGLVVKWEDREAI